MKLDHLKLWMDPVARSGPESMAIDEWLHSLNAEPILRVYRWKGEWGSLGYFDKLSEARNAFPDINQWVRRWTGGGTVDHRRDWAYTLLIPFKSIGNQRLGGAESYQFIHQALAKALAPEQLDVRLSGGESTTGAKACFENPVTHDLIDALGRKLAGAGQKRTKHGLMHQGSVSLPLEGEASCARAKRLADELAHKKWAAFMEEPPEEVLQSLQAKYLDLKWTNQRP